MINEQTRGSTKAVSIVRSGTELQYNNKLKPVIHYDYDHKPDSISCDFVEGALPFVFEKFFVHFLTIFERWKYKYYTSCLSL